MEFNELVKQHAERVSKIKDTIQTEEATKMSLIVPMFQILGYDVFNPLEFCPEYTADVGIKKGEKVDYAVLDNGTPSILIECKSCTEDLDRHASQLFRYFGTTSAKFGILTNGLIYRFYTDLEESNKMDLLPFLEVNLLNLKDSSITELKKFCKDNFDQDKIFGSAEELKYLSLIKEALASECENPSEEFVKFILSEVYDGQKTQKVIAKFTPVVKKAFSSFTNEIVNSRINAALNPEEPEEPEVGEEVTESKIVTTEEELDSFRIVCAIAAEFVPLEDVSYRDAESYFAIFYKDNNRKPICRINLNHKIKAVYIPDEKKNFTKYVIESTSDIYKYKKDIGRIIKFYSEQ